MKNIRSLAVVSLLIVGCSPSRLDSISATPSPSPTVPVESRPSPIATNFLVSERGIGPARLGMTLKQFKQKLGTDTHLQKISPFMVDLDAIAVYQSGKVQYYIPYPSGTTFRDTDSIEQLLTDNPKFRTAGGVGPGTSLKQAVAIYGEATLFYNTQNESREQVRFANYSPRNVFFQPGVPDREFAGVYPPSSEEYRETRQFLDSAIIRSILVTR